MTSTSYLIGSTGLIGSQLSRDMVFDAASNTVTEAVVGEFDLVVCAAPSGEKWRANERPDIDRMAVEAVIDRLSTVRAQKLVLISTVDVYRSTNGSCEHGLQVGKEHPYGFNRLTLENSCFQNFENVTVLRLGGLVGPGLKKNPVYDLANGNDLSRLNPESKLQFFPLENLHEFVRSSFSSQSHSVVNLTAPPFALGEVASWLGIELTNSGVRQDYNIVTCLRDFQTSDGYAASSDESKQAILRFFGGRR